MRIFLLALMALSVALVLVSQAGPPDTAATALDLIRQQRYNDAINKLEQILEATPGQPEALAYLGTAYLYLYGPRTVDKAKKLFEDSFRAGGGATFWVSHSHEKLSLGDLADYCRGWLHLRKDEVTFAPESGEHAFRLARSDIREFKQNRLARSNFHIKFEKKTYDFRPRSGDESETLLILAMYNKKFDRR